MRKIIVFLIFVLPGFGISAQTNGINADLQKIVETERAFARYAAEKGTKASFLEFAADDGVMFAPNAVNAKNYWNARGEWEGLLAWQPDFADVSSNGVLGYTAGPWEYRPKGKTGAPVAFGHFITLWQKQANGNYRWVLDTSVSHSKVQVEGVEWQFPFDAGAGDSSSKNSSAGDVATAFFEVAAQKGIGKAYKTFVADDVRLYRENKLPIVGKDNALSEIKKEKSSVVFAKRSTFFGSADLAYVTNTYTLTKPDKTTEKGNFVQIWKLRGGKWQIVLDLFNPIPEAKK
jgi:hypothetical protein